MPIQVFTRYDRQAALDACYGKENHPEKVSKRKLCLKLSYKVPEQLFSRMNEDWKNVKEALYREGRPCIKRFSLVMFKINYVGAAAMLSLFAFMIKLMGAAFTSRVVIRPDRVHHITVGPESNQDAKAMKS